MNRKTYFALIFVAVLCLLNSGCINIEQEIFLEPDGSGDLVMHISMPDIPDAVKKNAPPSQQDPLKLIDELKQKMGSELPATIKLKDVKEIKRNGAFAYYIVLHFDRLDDVSSMLSKISKEDLSDKSPDSKNESVWNLQMEKSGDLTVITQSFYADLMGALGKDKPPSDKTPDDKVLSITLPPPPPPPPPAPPKPAAKRGARRPARNAKPAAPPKEEEATSEKESSFEFKPDEAMKEMFNEETMNTLVSSMFKLRFVVHTPKKISESNADIVLNGNIAIWNASFGAFVKEKKPITMKVTY